MADKKATQEDAKQSDPKARTPRVFAFIDSQNLNVTTQKFGWKMDWRKFRQWLADEQGVTKAFMFIGYLPGNESLYEQMHEAGYAVVLKPTFDMTRPHPDLAGEEENGKAKANGDTPTKPEENKKPVKGNIDAELVLWAMKEMSNYEQAIIVSGDGDFYCLVEYLEEKGRLKYLLAPSSHYSSLYNTYDKYVLRLDTFRKDLAYHDRHDRNRPNGNGKPHDKDK